jgi:hypothetical protein
MGVYVGCCVYTNNILCVAVCDRHAVQRVAVYCMNRCRLNIGHAAEQRRPCVCVYGQRDVQAWLNDLAIGCSVQTVSGGIHLHSAHIYRSVPNNNTRKMDITTLSALSINDERKVTSAWRTYGSTLIQICDELDEYGSTTLAFPGRPSSNLKQLLTGKLNITITSESSLDND